MTWSRAAPGQGWLEAKYTVNFVNTGGFAASWENQTNSAMAGGDPSQNVQGKG